MSDGRDSDAVALAMDLLLRRGGALGAERPVDANSVCGTRLNRLTPEPHTMTDCKPCSNFPLGSYLWAARNAQSPTLGIPEEE